MPKARKNAMTSLKLYLWVGLGGALGAMLRFFTSEMATKLKLQGFPFATLAVNMLGSFLIGVAFALISRGVMQSDPLKTAITVGFLGALTTFSTFSMDTLHLLQSQQYLKSGVNIIANVTLCIGLAWAGSQLVLQKGL